MDQTQENGGTKGLFIDNGTRFEGTIHISEEVIVELTKKTIQGIPNIQVASTGIASKFGIGRKGGDGVRVSVEEGKIPAISVDVYVLVRYGQRIPDLAWDVQEKIKSNLERYTGYSVKAVNINVQGIYIDEPVVFEEAEEGEAELETAPETEEQQDSCDEQENAEENLAEGEQREKEPEAGL